MLGDDLLLFVTTDRVSAFDVVLPVGVPDKGTLVLTGLAGLLVRAHAESCRTILSAPTWTTCHRASRRNGTPSRGASPSGGGRGAWTSSAWRGGSGGTMWAEYRRTGDYQGFGLPPASRRTAIAAPAVHPRDQERCGPRREHPRHETGGTRRRTARPRVGATHADASTPRRARTRRRGDHPRGHKVRVRLDRQPGPR